MGGVNVFVNEEIEARFYSVISSKKNFCFMLCGKTVNIHQVINSQVSIFCDHSVHEAGF